VFKPLSQRLHERHVGEAFSGMVSFPNAPSSRGLVDYVPPPEERVPQPAVEPDGILARVLGRLMALRPETPELQRRLKEATKKAHAALSGVDKLVSECEEDFLEHWRQRHREIRAKGREQLEEVERLTELEAIAQRVMVDCDNAKSTWFARVQSAEGQRQSLSRFATDEEIEKAELRIVNAKVKCGAAIEAHGQSIGTYNAAMSATGEAKKKLGEIAADEMRIRSGLNGQPYHDPEFGLLVSA
jgi:hypothetical protein